MAKSKLDHGLEKDQNIDQRLRSVLTIWFTTVTPTNRPQSVCLWFVWDGETFLIFSKPDQKVRNLQNNPNVVLALDDTRNGDDPITIEGTAELLPAGSVDTTNAAYATKYAQLLSEMHWTAESMSQEYSQAIRITPNKFIAFGLK